MTPLLLPFEGVRLLGLDGAILALSVVVLAATWLGVRANPIESVAQTAAPGPAGRARARGGALLDSAAERVALAPATALGLLAAGLVVAWLGVRLLARDDMLDAGLVLAVCGAGIVVWLDRRAALAVDAPLPGQAAATGAADAASSEPCPHRFWEIVLPRATGTLRWVLVAVPAGSTLLVWRAMRARPLDQPHTDIVALWLIAIGGAALAVAWPLERPRRAAWTWVTERLGWIGLVAAVTLLAAPLRLWRPDRYPLPFTGDEGSFAMSAREVLEGRIQNPFGTGWFAHPSLFFYLQAWSIELFGNDVAGVRMLSGLLGVAAVVAVMLYARHAFGPFEAAVAGVLMATLHHHLFLSRTALNNVGDSLFLPLVLLLTDWGVLGRRRLASLAAGLVIGLSQYFYFGSRLLPLIAVAMIGGGVLFGHVAERATMATRARMIAPYAVLMVAGAAVTLMPYLAYYADHSVDANARINSVSIFASGWLDAEAARTGRSSLDILATRIWDAALLPFHGHVQGFYRPSPPYAGAPLALPVAIGLGLTLAGFRRRRYLGLAVAFAAVTVGLAITEGYPFQAHRYSGAVALFCVLAAVGFGAAARIAVRLARVDRSVVAAVIGVAVGLIGAWNYDFFFRDPNQVALYSDPNTQTAFWLAGEVKAAGPGVTVYFAGPPVMWYDGFASIRFIAPDATGISLDEPLTAAGPPPEVTGPTIFVFLPHRLDELAIVRGWFPGGVEREVANDKGMLLYVEYRLGLPAPAAG